MQAWLYKYMSCSQCNPACALIQHDHQYPGVSDDMTVGLRTPFMTLLQHASHRQVCRQPPGWLQTSACSHVAIRRPELCQGGALMTFACTKVNCICVAQLMHEDNGD